MQQSSQNFLLIIKFGLDIFSLRFSEYYLPDNCLWLLHNCIIYIIANCTLQLPLNTCFSLFNQKLSIPFKVIIYDSLKHARLSVKAVLLMVQKFVLNSVKYLLIIGINYMLCCYSIN